MPQDKQLPFWLIAFSFLVGLTVPVLIKDGMFMDGELYTCVAHNLSLGIGTFWFPQFSYLNMAGLTSFHEQPPLIFGIQALFFKVFGDSMYVERFYTFLALCISAWLIVILWCDATGNSTIQKSMGWLPVLMWITIPVTFWSYSNNMIENTVSVFTISAVIFIFRALKSSKNQTLLWLLGGFFIFLATFSKGFPGFFPIAVPALYWFIYKRENLSKIIYGTIVLVAVPLFSYAILFGVHSARESLSIYFFDRALSRINDLPTVTSRLYILYSLVMELLPQLIIVAIVLITGWRLKIKLLNNTSLREALFFITIGLAGTAPLMLTLVQKGFYYVPALPFFAIGLSILIAPLFSSFIEKINTETLGFRIYRIGAEILFAFVLIVSYLQIDKVSRDKDTLHDVYMIGRVLPKFSVVAAPPQLWNDWALQCYLMRYDNISIDCRGRQLNYYIIAEDQKADSLTAYERVDIPMQHYDLYVSKKYEYDYLRGKK